MHSKTKVYAITIAILASAAIFANYRYYNLFTPYTGKLTLAQLRKDYVAVFSQIYHNNVWTNGSGLGSDPAVAGPYMALLQQYIDDPRFTTIVDLGCGDWQIMRHLHIPAHKTYIGYDVVPDLIAANNAEFGRENVQFYHSKGLREFAKLKIAGDLLVVKDVLQHWPLSEVHYFLDQVLPNFKYALLTHLYMVDHPSHNQDAKMGPTHSIGLLSPPFELKNATVVLEYDGPDHKQVLFYVNPRNEAL